jgi:peptide/nickel transport system permease protein
MANFLIGRIVRGLMTVLLISVITFLIIQLPPGDYITSYIAEMGSQGSPVSQEEAANLRARYGLDEPFVVQYLMWMGEVVQGRFGISMEWRRPVADVVGERMLLTVVMSTATILLTWAIALPIGIYSAVRQYSFGDYLFTSIGFIGLAVPNFLLSLVVMYIGFAVFGVNVGGLFSPEFANAPWSMARAVDLAAHLPIPALILGLSSSAQLIRILRANLIDELNKPYVVTALAKGLSPMKAILKYPVRVALNPFVSTVGYVLPFVVSGSIIVSLVMGLPTVGPVLYKSLIAQDMFLAGTIVLLLGVLTVIGTLISDLLLLWIDPRIRLEVGHG